jgi:DNA-binding Lrp family transcriptional regulator
MSSAYVMINTVPDKVEAVLNEVKEIEGVKEAYIIYGVYDIIAGVKAKKNDDLWDIIIKIRKLKNILSTITLQVTS